MPFYEDMGLGILASRGIGGMEGERRGDWGAHLNLVWVAFKVWRDMVGRWGCYFPSFILRVIRGR